MHAGWVCRASYPVSGLGFVARSPSSTFYFFPAALNSAYLWIPLCLGLYPFLCSVSFLPRARLSAVHPHVGVWVATLGSPTSAS